MTEDVLADFLNKLNDLAGGYGLVIGGYQQDEVELQVFMWLRRSERMRKMEDKLHWIDLGDGEYKCPKCSREFMNGLDIQTFSKYFPSCPNCGAEMGSEE
jgi:DNA-directed RNA polymerase subunit RPC12/RpoP